MKGFRLKIKRSAYIATAFIATLAIGVPSLLGGSASAVTGQLQSRSITMSDANGADAGVSYKVGFTSSAASGSYTVKGIVVDFCSGDPIIGNSTCALPSGFSLSGVTVDTTTAPDTGLGAGWSVTIANSNRTLELTNATGAALNTTSVIFTIAGVHNPTAVNTSFYARILTYNATAGATGYVAGSENTGSAYFDYGGVALSTDMVVNITAKVMETLNFCVYPGAGSCGTDPSFTIGHAVGSATVIDSTAVDTTTIKWTLSTNANTGAIIRLQGDTLKSGSNSIAAAGASPATITNGQAGGGFGLYISVAGTNITKTSPYTGGSGSQYGLDTANSTLTFGSQLAQLTAATNGSISTVTYGATAANTTPAGTYTATHQLIATGTF